MDQGIRARSMGDDDRMARLVAGGMAAGIPIEDHGSRAYPTRRYRPR